MNSGSSKISRLRRVTGVTLIELMITAAILSIGVLAAIGSFHYIAVSLQNSKTRTLANNLAQEQIEKLKNLSYYMLLVTTSTYSDTRFSPALDYDTGNYPSATIVEGGIAFTRATRIDFAYQNGNNITALPFTSNDSGLKLLTTYVIWRDGAELRSMQMQNLMANPAANPLNATFRGTVTGPAGVLVPGALVQVVDNPNWFGFSNSAGVYSFAVSQGSYTLEVSSSGYFAKTTNDYKSISSGQTLTVDFSLMKMSSGTARGNVYLNDHLVISQVVGSTINGTGFYQEYVEVFNPSSYTWTMASNATTPVIALKYHRAGDALTTIQSIYNTLTVGPGSYFLFANTGTVRAVNRTIAADAVFSASNADFPNIIKIDTDAGSEAAGVGIAFVASGAYIDQVGWKKGGSTPPLYEGTDIAQVVGLEDNEQFVRLSSTGGVIAGLGRAFDSNNNNVDFDVTGRQPMIYPPRNSLNSETVVAGTPAIGAYVLFNDPLSQTGQCLATTVGIYTLCAINVPSIATGTWTMTVSSGAYYAQIGSVVMTPSLSTGVPNGSTNPVWPAGASNTLLRETTNFAFISGVVTDAANIPLSNITVEAGGMSKNTSSLGRYFLSVPAGDVRLTANYNNSNLAYTSDSTDLTSLVAGTLYDNPTGLNTTWFTLSLGGILRGYFQTGSNTPLPGRVAVALSGGSQAGQAVSGNNGYFYINNLTTGTYTVQPAIDSAESANPASVSVTLTSTGTATAVSTFTITNGLGQITGQALLGTSAISTGVLVFASTATLAGGATTPPPAQSGGSGILCNPCNYSGSSDSGGRFTLDVRNSATPYNLYGWYSTLSGTTATVTRKGPYPVSITSAGQIVSQNIVW